MIEKFEEWLNNNLPKSTRNYMTGYKTLDNLSDELSLPVFKLWNIDNYDEYSNNLKNVDKFKELNKKGNNMYSGTLSNFKKFLNATIVIPPKLPFEEFTWRWASKGSTEGINKKEVLFGVLSILVKFNGKIHATKDFYNNMEILEKKLNLKIDLKRTISKNIIENSGQYWKALGLIKTTTDGTINVTDFGLSIIENGISDENFIKWQINNFVLPNIEAEKKSTIDLFKKYNIEIKPLELLINILSNIYSYTNDKIEWYITVDELRTIIIPLSINQNIPASTYIEHIFKYRIDKTKYNSWLKFEDRMIREYLLFLNNFNVLTEFQTKSDMRYYINDATIKLFQNATASDNITEATNIIYFGSPGTGKSKKATDKTQGHKVTRITFHPEYDYNSFVGGYKPIMSDDGESIKYKFVPQAFTNIFVQAWENILDEDSDDEHYFLQIEEINRGNCAEIFGDLFQLLDRDDDGYSEYGINPNEELKKYLEDKFGVSKNKVIVEDKIKLPNNLSIIATMNTSDQSLFPMDSAFKRRWDWEYVSIDYNCEISKKFIIKIDDNTEYNWLDFLKFVNKKIVDVTQSQDKQLGNWFVNAKKNNIIDKKTFINKVLFYLWNDVFKDEEDTIFQQKIDDNITSVYYEDFFDEDTNQKLIKYIMEEELKLTNSSSQDNDNIDTQNNEDTD